MHLEENRKTELKLKRERERERARCVELLKATLTTGADERITPLEVLAHPFITKHYLKEVRVCVCVCVCEREGERERERGHKFFKSIIV